MPGETYISRMGNLEVIAKLALAGVGVLFLYNIIRDVPIAFSNYAQRNSGDAITVMEPVVGGETNPLEEQITSHVGVVKQLERGVEDADQKSETIFVREGQSITYRDQTYIVQVNNEGTMYTVPLEHFVAKEKEIILNK